MKVQWSSCKVLAVLVGFLFLNYRVSVLADASPNRYFVIQVQDEQTGRGVPLVELKTVSNLRFYTDSGGYSAIDDPALMNQRVYFSIISDGYEFPIDGFGNRGRAFDIMVGEQATLKI